MPACLVILARIHERDRVVEMLLMGLEAGRSLAELLIARAEVDSGPVRKFPGAIGNEPFQQALGLLKLVLLHGLESSLIILHSLCKNGILLEGRLRLEE